MSAKHDMEARAFGRTEAARLKRLGVELTVSEALQLGYVAGRARQHYTARLLGEFTTAAAREVA
jgi:hypothetical protein